ncbi:MAG: 50S ribosomal protein L15 [Lachnospiraceae bacterium]|nr:50S ribosomal protein L15 [Lachnospiraceae bacterium]
MKLNNLVKSPETKTRKRVGRGNGSGLGKTAGTGEKGQKSRSGVSISPWFEGGQTPLYRRIPKRGFNNARFRKEFAVVNLSDLNKFNDGDTVTPATLVEKGIVKKEMAGIKVLANGKLEKKVNVKANRFSSVAVTKIEELGGTTEVI